MDLLETPRLLLRPFGAGDAVLVHEVYSDPEVMRYVATGPMADIAVTERLLADYTRASGRHGYSFWAVIERASGTLIGDAGLYRTPRARSSSATRSAPRGGGAVRDRGASRWLAFAFGELGLSEVVALAEPANAASLHVLEKLGMRRDGERIAFGRPHAVFRAQRAASMASIPSSMR